MPVWDQIQAAWSLFSLKNNDNIYNLFFNATLYRKPRIVHQVSCGIWKLLCLTLGFCITLVNENDLVNNRLEIEVTKSKRVRAIFQKDISKVLFIYSGNKMKEIRENLDFCKL